MKIAKLKNNQRGFSIFITVIIMGVLMVIAFTVANISSKEITLSTTNRESQYAIFAADAGIECALYWDTKNSGGLSAFDSNAGASSINCAGVTMTDGAGVPGTSTLTLIGGAVSGGSMPVNFAANGGGAFPSSENGNHPSSGVINGDRSGTTWDAGPSSTGGWESGTFPNSMEIRFSSPKDINKIDVFTLPNNYQTTIPDGLTSASDWGMINFLVQYDNSGIWQTFPGGNVIGNNLAWIPLNSGSTINGITKIRVYVANATDVRGNQTRITEIEAWGSSGSGSGSRSVFGFNLSDDPTESKACSIVTVDKNPDSTTHIFSRGYNTCDLNDPKRVERGIEVRY